MNFHGYKACNLEKLIYSKMSVFSIMHIKKRGRVFLIASAIFLLIYTTFVFAGYCLNPISTFYCQEVTENTCCSGSCGSGEYTDAPGTPSECEMGCCFAISIDNPCVSAATAKGLCENENGLWAASCVSLSQCEEGCCCWEDGAVRSDASSERRFKGRCDAIPSKYNPEFYSGITDIQDCTTKCNTDYKPPGLPSGAECSDHLDNDGDGRIDFPEDPGCSDPSDQSETDLSVQCDDGVNNDPKWDNDIDAEDSCCQSFPDKAEDFCNLDECTTGERISANVEECRCRSSYRCKGGDYCCDTGCKQVPCGSEACIPGERRSCGTSSGSCELFRYCKQGGIWGTECTPDPACAFPVEKCFDGIDNNNDGNIDCEDVTCHGVECNHGERTCQRFGIKDIVNDVWSCCYGVTSDCDADGIPDTCGGCSCRQTMPEPYITSVEKPQGESYIKIEWGLNCDVDAYVYKCLKGETNCESPSEYTRISTSMSEWQYEDENIKPNGEYCYFIQADYGLEKKNSEMMCEVSGDLACMGFKETDFCLNETLGAFGKRTIRAQCDENNELVVVENCAETHDENYIRMGPYPGIGTKCEYQSNCDSCGGHLDMFADFSLSKSTYTDPMTSTNYDMACRNIPTCYYDYSDTTVDKFHECSNIDVCYKYRSQSACEEQHSEFNNKCLPRDCSWTPLPGELDLGICFETSENFKSCESCNIAENNKIFDKCTKDKCMMFGDCYLRRIDGACMDKSVITCNDYATEEECIGSKPVDVNVKYDSSGTRLSGNYDNSIDPSNDVIGIGLCRWMEDADPGCFKDADGDMRPDPAPYDKTPPYSRMATPSKVLALNFTIEVSDVNPDGSPGMGVKRTFVCMDDSYCYPT